MIFFHEAFDKEVYDVESQVDITKEGLETGLFYGDYSFYTRRQEIKLDYQRG